jgi:hypothetical protein
MTLIILKSLVHIVATVTLDRSVAKMTLYTTVASCTIVVFVIALFALVTSSCVMLHKEHF